MLLITFEKEQRKEEISKRNTNGIQTTGTHRRAIGYSCTCLQCSFSYDNVNMLFLLYINGLCVTAFCAGCISFQGTLSYLVRLICYAMSISNTR